MQVFNIVLSVMIFFFYYGFYFENWHKYKPLKKIIMEMKHCKKKINK